MNSPKEYTAYKRNNAVSVIVYWGLWVVLVIWFGGLTDSYPNLNEFLAVLLLVGIVWGPFFAGQLLSRRKCIVTVKAGALVHIDAVSPHAFVPNDYPVVMLKDVTEISTGHGMFAGNYISLRFRYGHTLNLYAKRHLFSKSPAFFDLYIALKNAWNAMEEIEREKIKTAKDWEGFTGTRPASENSTANLPDITEPTSAPAPAASTPIPPATTRVRSAVRSDSLPKWEPEAARKTSDTGNGIIVAAVIFCVFLLGVAGILSSFEVPAGFEGVRDVLYTSLVLIAAILIAILVVPIIMKKYGQNK